MENKFIIMWEITLRCNLKCNFCISKKRRELNKIEIKFNDAIRIINNLPLNSHISFVGGESFLFPDFIQILKYLDKKGITYEITTNGTLINNKIKDINNLKNLTNIYLSIDSYGNKHDKIRSYKGLFNNNIENIKRLKKQINVNSVITPLTLDSDIIKLYYLLSKLDIYQYRISYYMNFNKTETNNSIKKVKRLKIKTKFNKNINNYKLRIKTIRLYYKLLLIKKKTNLKTNIDFHPISILKGKLNGCKSLHNYYRINEKGYLSICHFIDNNFDCIINTSFKKAITNSKYIKLKNKIKNQFPLDICLTCGKGI